MKIKTSPVLLAAALMASAPAQAAFVTGWSEVGANQPLSNANTASPTLGDGTANSADTGSIYASFPAISLSNAGDNLTMSGTAVFTLISGTTSLANQFRFGVFNSSGSGNDLGWLGYFAGNGDATGSAQLYERNNPNTATFPSVTGATQLATAAAPGVNFESGNASDTYSFSFTLARVASGMQINTSIIRASDSQQMGAISFLDTTISTSTFDRVGFLTAGNLDVETVQFNDITVVPEPSVALLAGPGLLALLRRRRS